MALCALAVFSSANARSLGESNLSNPICWLDMRMTVAWTQHRFSGGVLALDTTNTVVHRCDPSRRFDRFDDTGRNPALRGRGLDVPPARRSAAAGGRPMPRRCGRNGARTAGIDRCAVSPAGVPASRSMQARWPTFLRACAAALDGQPGTFGERRRAVRRGRLAAAVRDGAGGFGAVAARRRQSQES